MQNNMEKFCAVWRFVESDHFEDYLKGTYFSLGVLGIFGLPCLEYMKTEVVPTQERL